MLSSRVVTSAFLLALACVSAFPDNIQQAKQLAASSDELRLEAEASDPQPRKERCATCGSGQAHPAAIPFALPAGAEVHSQSSFEGCSTEKGCAGIKVKDGKIIEKYGDVSAFNAAASADKANEYSFHAGLEGNEVLEGGIPKNGPFWWMKENSPFREAYQAASTGAGSGAGGASFSASLDLSGNPFLNGDITKLASGFIGGGQGASSSGSFGSSHGGVDISNNPFLNGQVKPSGGSSFQSSSFESTYSTSGKDAGAIDLSKNPFLNGAGFSGSSKFGAGQTGQSGQGGQVSGGKFSSSSNSYGSQSSGQFGGTGNGGNYGGNANGGQFGVQAGFQSGQFGSPGSSSTSKFSSSSSGSTGYTGSSPSPFTASTGSKVNQIDSSKKTSEFDFEQQQQTQQNIDEIYSQGDVSHKHEEHNAGELQQTCAGQGYICVHKAQCNNGVVNTNGAGILQARTKKQYCNIKTEICCRIEVSNIPGSGIDLQGSLGVGSATFGASGSGSSIFGTDSAGSSSTFGSTASGNKFASGSNFGNSNQFGAGSATGSNQFGSGSSTTGSSQFGASFGTTGASNQFGQAGSSGQNFGAGANGNSNGFGTTNTFESSSSTFESSSRGGANGANGASGNNFGATGTGSNSGSTFGASGNGFAAGSNTGSSGANGFGASGTFGFKETGSSSFDSRYNGNNGGGLIHIAPSGSDSGIVFKESTNTQNNFIETTRNTETDSFSAGSQSSGVIRPGTGPGQRPGVPYLPPLEASASGTSNTVTTGYKPSSPAPRPYSPTTTGPGYLPPQGEQSINRPTFVPGPRAPEDTEGSLLLDQNRQPRPKPRLPNQPGISDFPAGCAAALKCTPVEFCTAEGVISNTSVRLSKDQEDFRVPLTDCKDIASGTIGKCCRDPTYTDPWPTNQLGKWVPGVFGGDDGAYKPDSRGSSNNPRPISVRPTPAPTTGGVLLNNYRTTLKPDFPYPGPNQVTPGFGGVTQSPYAPQGPAKQPGPFGQQGPANQPGPFGPQGPAKQPGPFGPQGTKGSSGSFGQGQQVSQGFGQSVTQGFGQTVTQGQGQAVSQGQGQFGQQGQGQAGQQGFGQTFTQTSQTTTTTQQQGQFGQAGQGQSVSQGQGQFGSQGQGQFGQRGQGQTISQGQGQFGQTGQGQIVSQGQGQFGQRGQGQIVTQGQGEIISQGQGQFGQNGQGQFGQRGQGQAVSQGQGQFGQRGQGQVVSQGQGEIISQGQGQFGQRGQGQTVTQGQGEIISQGQGQFSQSGQGQIVSQGQGQIASQGAGAFGQYDAGESVQRVFLSQYSAGGQCGLQKGQKPYGSRNDLEVDFAEIPWQAMVLLQTNRSLLCGGVITRPEVVITSAACVEGLQAKHVLIKGGEWKLGIDEEPLPFQIVQVKTILRHPGYRQGSLHNDVAILILAEKLRLANNIYPICLPGQGDTLDGFYNGAGECIVTGWGKQVLQVNVAGAIMHSLNVSLINPGECQAKISQDYPHLLEQYDADSCACGQPTNPLNNVCRVDVGSALACTTGDGHFVLRGVYSWDSGCQAGNQLAAFYKFDLEWYNWALGLSEGSGRYTQQFGGQAQISQQYTQGSQFSQFGQGVKGFGGFNAGIKGAQLNSGVKGGQGFSSSFSSQSSFSEKDAGEAGFGKFGFAAQAQPAGKFQYETKTPIKGSSFSSSFSSQEKQYYQSKPQIVTYTTKPEIITYTTKPEIYTYTTKPKVVTYTTKPQIITYETSGSGQNPQYVAPGVTFNPSFGALVGDRHAQAHGAQCKCLENGKK